MTAFLLRFVVRFIAVLGCISTITACGPGGKAHSAALHAALLNEDLGEVKAAVAAVQKELGAQAGLPEVADQYVVVPNSFSVELLAKAHQVTQQPKYLDTIHRLASEEARRGKLPLGPRGWGEMLERCAAPH